VENSSDNFDGWIKTQQQAITALRDQALQMQSYFKNSAATAENPFSNWSKAVLDAFPTGDDANLTKGVFNKTLFNTEVLQKLYEFWQPLLKAIAEKSIDSASYASLTDPDKLKQLYDKLFNFDLDALNQLQKQTSQYNDVYQQFTKPWNDAAKTQASNFLQGDFSQSEMTPQAWLQQMQAAYAAFEKTTGKILSVPTLGKDREKMALFSKYTKALTTFTSRHQEYYQLMQTTGYEGNQAVIKALAEKVKAGEKFEKFDEFFALWINTNEKVFFKLFQSKEFNERRNAMTVAGFNARKLYNEIIEGQLSDLPVARRSEMNEVYKIIYDLRKQVKSLQSQIQDLKTQR
jgi:class III poly(R)-hydroxyalkanoic acid synthase PhaE subunit